MKVFAQGFDGLCGFYAALNAFRHLQSQIPGSFSLEEDDRVYFDDLVEELSRIRGASLNMIKGDPEVGGLDANYILALCMKYIRKHSLPIKVEYCEAWPDMTFANRYRWLWRRGTPFVFISLQRGGGHWVAVGRNGQDVYDLMDEGIKKKKKLSDRSTPLSGCGGLGLTAKVTAISGQDN